MMSGGCQAVMDAPFVAIFGSIDSENHVRKEIEDAKYGVLDQLAFISIDFYRLFKKQFVP